MFLLMRAEIIPGFTPFAAAFFAAALTAGENPAALVLGTLTGMLRLPLRDISLISAVGCAGVLAGEILISVLPVQDKLSRDSRASLTAGFGVLIPALAFAGGDVLFSMQALGCAALAASSAPFMLPAVLIRPGRKRLMTQEKIGAVLLAGSCLMGINMLFPPLARASALLLILMFPETGAAGGVIWSLFLGSGPELAACLSLCGFVSGLDLYRHRWQRCASAAACWCILALLMEGFSPWECLSAAIPPLVPRYLFDGMRIFTSKPDLLCDPARISREACAESAHRLRSLGDAFAEMAEGCACPGDVPDEQALMHSMRDRLCSGCPDYAACWAGEDNGAVRFLCKLIEDAVSICDAPAGMRVIYSDGEIPPDILRFCRRGRMIPDRLGLLLRDFAEKRRAEIKRCATGQMLSQQLSQAREILYDLAENRSSPVSGRRMDALHAALDAAMRDRIHVSAFGSDAPEVHLRKDGGWTRSDAQRAGEALHRAWGGDFTASLSGDRLVFRRKPRLDAETGAACQSGMPGRISGDSHMIHMLGGSRMALMLSDGMGSGDAAARESGETLRLLRCFLDAGISRPLALETVNRQMLMRTGDDVFATVDLCILDLNTGVAEFSKLAACRTLILRGNELLRIEGGRLPLGILEGVQSDLRRVKLKDGDMIVMGSDGVMELGDGMVIDRIARLSSHLEPQSLAEKLVREAAVRRSRGRMDDMTCLCVRIRMKNKKTSAAEA